MKEIRFNANGGNSDKLRRIQAEYKKRFSPARISLDALANLAIECGLDSAKQRLLPNPFK